MSQMSQTCLLITLIKCLKGHKSLGSLDSVVKGLIVSLVRPTDQGTKGQGHQLSCSGQLKNIKITYKEKIFVYQSVLTYDLHRKTHVNEYVICQPAVTTYEVGPYLNWRSPLGDEEVLIPELPEYFIALYTCNCRSL